jgi:hypothetical protein
VRAPRLAEQGERAPGAGVTGQHGPQFVGETARPPQLALAQAPVEFARCGAAEAGRRLIRAGEGGELLEVRLPQLDLGEPDHRRGRQAILDDFTGRQKGRRVDRQQAYPVKGDGAAQDARDGPGEILHAEVPVDEPDDVATGTFARRSRNHHGSTIPTPPASTQESGMDAPGRPPHPGRDHSIQEYLHV